MHYVTFDTDKLADYLNRALALTETPKGTTPSIYQQGFAAGVRHIAFNLALEALSDEQAFASFTAVAFVPRDSQGSEPDKVQDLGDKPG